VLNKQSSNVPIARHRPAIPAYMSGVRPALSARVTSPLLLMSICSASQWSLYVAAWTDVLQ